MSYAAGVLLLSWHEGKLLCLLGKDHYNSFSDFGGKVEMCDNNCQMNTASREMYEETCGVFSDIHSIRDALNRASFIDTLSYTNKPYTMYILFAQYDPTLPIRFDYAYNFVRHVPNMNRFTEKKRLHWFYFDNVCNGKVELRNIFGRTIAKHKNSILKIAYNYYSTNLKYYNGRPRVQ